MSQVMGSGSSYYEHMDSVAYAGKINTPAKSHEYFKRFHAPLVARAKSHFGPRITVVDIACGPAFELEFLRDDPGVRLFATDISPAIIAEVQERFGSRVWAEVDDASSSRLPLCRAEAGMLVNAMVYVPADMLRTMYRVLAPSGECVVNFRVFANTHNRVFYDYYTDRGGVIRDHRFEAPGERDLLQNTVFNVKVLDYAECVQDDGSPDLSVRQLGQQIYFQSTNDIERLVGLAGFKVMEHDLFNFASPVNPDNQVDVYTLQKPY